MDISRGLSLQPFQSYTSFLVWAPPLEINWDPLVCQRVRVQSQTHTRTHSHAGWTQYVVNVLFITVWLQISLCGKTSCFSLTLWALSHNLLRVKPGWWMLASQSRTWWMPAVDPTTDHSQQSRGMWAWALSLTLFNLDDKPLPKQGWSGERLVWLVCESQQRETKSWVLKVTVVK